jgi:hypothetical protein
MLELPPPPTSGKLRDSLCDISDECLPDNILHVVREGLWNYGLLREIQSNLGQKIEKLDNEELVHCIVLAKRYKQDRRAMHALALFQYAQGMYAISSYDGERHRAARILLQRLLEEADRRLEGTAKLQRAVNEARG